MGYYPLSLRQSGAGLGAQAADGRWHGRRRAALGREGCWGSWQQAARARGGATVHRRDSRARGARALGSGRAGSGGHGCAVGRHGAL